MRNQQTAQLVIRINQELKKDAQNVAENFGLSLSSLIKAFLTNVIKVKKLSLNNESDEYFDSIIMEACRDKKVASKLEKLASAIIKKYPRAL